MTTTLEKRCQIDAAARTGADWIADTCERWREIRHYEGLYKVSSLARVMGLERTARICPMGVETTRRVPSRIRKPKRGDGRRLRIKLSRDGIHVAYDLATVVLEAFTGPRPPGHYAKHLNGDLADCRLVNLQWAPLPYRDGRR